MDLGFKMVNSPLLTHAAKSTCGATDCRGTHLQARAEHYCGVGAKSRWLCSLSKVSVAPSCRMESFLMAPTATAARPLTSSLDPLPMA